MLLETCISIMTALEAGTRLYDWFSGARLGKSADDALQHRRRDDPDLIKLSDHIFVDRSLREVITPGAATDLQDLRVMRELMEPVATAINGSVLSSQILHTPSKLREAFRQNPWEVLDDIRPVHRAPSLVRPDWVPIAFLDSGIENVG